MEDIANASPLCKGQPVDSVGIAPAPGLDSKVVHKVAVTDGELKLDIDAMLWLARRLTLDDMGRLTHQIARAALAKRPSELQRLLLAIVAHDVGEAGQ